MTTATELAEAAASPSDLFVGSRILDEGTYATIDHIDPGATVGYHLRLRRDELPVEEEGVYWFGVHALGNNDLAGQARADGRARTFLPLLGARHQARTVSTSLLIPLRRRVVRAPDGRVAYASRWTTALSPGGRLNSLVDVGLAADGRSVTWLVDPAVLDAIHQLAAGNPTRFLGPTDGDGTDGASGSPDPSASASTSPSPSPTPSEEAEPDPVTEAAADAATGWLERFERARVGAEVAALPYGDLDLSAVAAAGAPELYAEARERSKATLSSWGIASQPVDAPLNGYADPDGLALGDSAVPVLMTDRAFTAAAEGVEGGVPPVVVTSGRRALVTSSAAAAGGPGPGDPLGTVPLRQRILAEAAVRILDAGTGGAGSDPEPLVVSMPWTWDPAGSYGFFEGLDLPWIDLDTLAGSVGSAPAQTLGADPDYPEAEADAQLDPGAVRATLDLAEAGQTLQRVLTRNDQVADEVLDDALTGSSYTARGGDGSAARRSLADIQEQLASITVSTSRRVTLSSTDGQFPATVTNGLDQAVTVLVQPITDTGLEVTPPEAVQVPPRGRAQVLLDAHASRIGLHNVTLVVTDTEGHELGSRAHLPVRAAQVSGIIWLFIATGAALLFGAIGLRLVRRLRGRDPETGAPVAADGEPQGGTPDQGASPASPSAGAPHPTRPDELPAPAPADAAPAEAGPSEAAPAEAGPSAPGPSGAGSSSTVPSSSAPTTPATATEEHPA